MYVCAHVDTTSSIFYAFVCVCAGLAFLFSTEAESQMNLEFT